jgi:hypothetical protein
MNLSGCSEASLNLFVGIGRCPHTVVRSNGRLSLCDVSMALLEHGNTDLSIHMYLIHILQSNQSSQQSHPTKSTLPPLHTPLFHHHQRIYNTGI